MSCTLDVFVSFVCLVIFFGSVEPNGKFLLKKNFDGTFLLVPAPANASVESTVDLKNLPPIAVADSTPRDPPGINSQSPPIPVSENPPAAATPANAQVRQICMQGSKGITLLTNLFYSIP